MSERDTTRVRCIRCGRAVSEFHGTAYVFGKVCDRADCHRVKQALSKRFEWFWFMASPPVEPGDPGRVAAFTMDGEYNNPRGMGEMSLQEKIEADRMVEA